MYLHRWRRNEILRKGKLDPAAVPYFSPLTDSRAKYIEGLENRLGRMESLLKLSGLLSEEDGDRTDLGTLEKRLADKTHNASQGGTPTPRSPNGSNQQHTGTDSQRDTPQREKASTPRSSVTSTDPPREGEEEVEALSDMMCSLVTNNCGETRYIGIPQN